MDMIDNWKVVGLVTLKINLLFGKGKGKDCLESLHPRAITLILIQQRL